jgi:hypothetical protein
MSVIAGANMPVTGLSLEYDMVNTARSWQGAPTTNLVDPYWSSWSIDGSGQGSIGTRTLTGPFACTITDSNANTRQNIYITSGISANTAYTFSVQYQKLYGAPTLRFQIQAYNDSTFLSVMSFATTTQLGIVDTDGWQTAKITLTTPANCNRILWFMQDGDDYTTYTHSFNLANVQCEQQSFATPFCYPARSNTQALLDLTRNNTITANSLTYNSDNTFSYDGSTNFIGPGALPGSYSQFTVSVWFYPTSVNNYRNPIDCNFNYNPTSGNIGPRLEMNSAGNLAWNMSGNTGNNNIYDNYTVISSGMVANTWYNVVITRDGSNLVSTYLNGSVVTNQLSNPNGFVNVFNNVVFGKGFHLSGAAERSFVGTMPLVQIYNTGLTSTQITQLFNAYRGRYGL